MHFITRSPWLTALGSSLVNSLWQMALVWLVYILITGTNKRFSSAARHALAIASLTLGSGWFMLNLIQTLSHPGDPVPGLANILLNPEANLTKGLHNGRKWLEAALPFLSFAYLAIVFFMLLRHVLYYRHLQIIRSTGLHKIQPRLKLFTATTAAHMGIGKKVMVWLSEAVDTPVTIGFFKPIILIPLAIINHLTMEQVEAILLHELSHIRRNDYLINLFITWAGIVFFFNPFSRLLIRSIRKEREHCCDDLVLQFQYNPQDYALALLSLEKKRQRAISLAMAAVGKGQPLLLERVKRLTGQPETARRYSMTLLLFLLFSLLLAAGMMVKEKKRPGLLVQWDRPSKTSTPEIVSVKYVTAAAPSVVKTVKFLKKNNKPDSEEDLTTDEESNVVFAGNSESADNTDMVTAIAPAVHLQNREFSIITSVDATPAPATEDQSLPYVPSTSYSYQVQDDTVPQAIIPGGEESRAAMVKSIQAIKQLNWKKIEKKISKNSTINVLNLQKEIQQSLREVDWQKINDQNSDLLSEAGEKRLKESIDLQVEAYNNIKASNPEHARTLQRKIRQDQLRLRQDYLKKQLESIQKQQEQLRKFSKIVYI